MMQYDTGIDEKQYLTVADIAAALGVQLSTVRSYAARGQMPEGNGCPCCGLGPVWARYVLAEWRPGKF